MKTDVEWRKEFEDRFGRVRDSHGEDMCREFDEFVRRAQRDAHLCGMASALEGVVKACRASADVLSKDARSSADRSDDLGMIVGKAMGRAYETLAEINERAARAIRDAVAAASQLSGPDVPSGNNGEKR